MAATSSRSWSTDTGRGTTETAHSGWVNIDSGAPLEPADDSIPALAPDAAGGWHNAAQVVTFSAADGGADAVSGMAGIEYDLDGAATCRTRRRSSSARGSHAVRYRAVDRAGNVEDAHDAFVNLDLTAPSISSSADGDVAWHDGDDVTLTSGDTGGSGLDRNDTRAGTSGTWTDVSGDSFAIPAAWRERAGRPTSTRPSTGPVTRPSAVAP